MPHPDTLLNAAGVVQVVEQTWRLDPDGPTGNSSARIGEQAKITPGQVQQAREGEAWLISRGRYQHLIVTRTQIPPPIRDRAMATIALARSLRPEQPLPGARSWAEVQETSGVAAIEVEHHLAIEPPPARDRASAQLPDLPPSLGDTAEVNEHQDHADHAPKRSGGPVDAAGWRLRLAIATAAREADRGEVAALIRHGVALGFAEPMLVGVAHANWPPAVFPLRACRAGLRWLRARAQHAGHARRAQRAHRGRGVVQR
jgi:hypothetical protein